MFKKWALRHKIIFLAIMPTIIVTIMLGFYFTFSRTSDLKENLMEHGQLILTEASISAIYSIKNNQPAVISDFIQKANGPEDPRVKNIVIYDMENNIIYGKETNTESVFLPKDILDQSEIKEKSTGGIVFSDIFIHKSYQYKNSFLFINKILVNKKKYWVVVSMDAKPYQNKIMGAIIALTLSFMWGVIVSIIAGFKISREVATPIISAIRCVNLIRQGKLDARMNANTQGEMEALKLGINSMAENLENVHKTMKQNIVTATKDLRDALKHVANQNDQLDLAKNEALLASKAKSEFLANMSHEIRTPMNSILGFTNLLLSQELTNEQKDWLLTIDKSAQNLLTIINDILDLSKIESGSFELFPEIFSLKHCSEEVVKMLNPQISNKKIELNINIDQEVPEYIIQDSIRLKQVLTNLINNAIKFTDKGFININASKISSSFQNYILKIEVIDSGIGISKDGIKKLFTSFSQADTSNKRKYGGTGLGLNISKKIIEKMSGKIGVESIKNKGSTFWFTFECKKSNEKPTTDTKIITKKIDINKINKLNILNVDDSIANLKLITSIMQKLGHTTTSYNNATDALKYLENKKNYKNIDIIFMDIQMPIMDGFAAINKIHEISKKHNKKIPVIALTADVFAETKDKIFKHSFSGYQTKPITKEQIIKILEKYPTGNKAELIQGSNKNQKISLNKINDKIINIEQALPLTGGDKDLLKEMQSMLLTELKSEIKNIEIFYNQKDYISLRALAHKIQGGASYCGTIKLKEDSKELEKICMLLEKENSEENITKISESVSNLLRTIKITIAALEKII